MNRRQRRTAAKTKGHAPPTQQGVPTIMAAVKPGPDTMSGPEAKPGFLLRLFARILLAPCVLKRIRHADVERLIAGVAVQAGRPEIAANILNRLAMRNDGRR